MNSSRSVSQKIDLPSGYRILREAALPDIEAVFFELEHTATGARHIHIKNKDRENAFGVVFKTVPKDSTGVAHILEHTILCGSQKFPVRDPFFSMLKRSLSTFMNALTASDWTMYPFATQNKKDYYNLMDVYLNSVFYPRLDVLSFKQEGHRLDIETEPQNGSVENLVYRGVVYNEMKGAMSSPDQVMARSLLKALYPSTTYRFNSGGEPAVIPRLTHEQLKAFHRHHYHPSNSYFYTYGDLPLADHLAFIDDTYLKSFSRIHPDTDVPSQPRWGGPRRETHYYPIAENEDPARKCQAALAWLTADVRATYDVLVLTLLEQILLGNPASPLRRALIDSQLGTALCDAAGFDGDNRDTMFVCGLKGVDAAAADEIETLILEQLHELVAGGIDPRLIESAIHQIEFHRKEITNTPYPFGIKQLLMVVGNWIHGGDPLKRLQFDVDLKEIRRQAERNRLFEGAIDTHFLQNPHRVLFTLVPDPDMERKERQRIAEELRRIESRLDEADRQAIKDDAEKLAQLQEADEDVSCLPTLKRQDIPAQVEHIAATSETDAIPLAVYTQNTSDIFYFTAAIGVGALAQERLPLIPFFCYALPRIGTLQRDYTEMVRRIDLYTGGVGLSPHARMAFDSAGTCVPFVGFNAKCLNRNQDRMFDIIAELMTQADFSDGIRLKNLLMEYRASLESMVVNRGHQLAISLAARNFSANRFLSEIWNGVTQLRAIKEMTVEPDAQQLKSIGEALSRMRDDLFVRQNTKLAVIGEAQAVTASRDRIAVLYDQLKQPNGDAHTPPREVLGPPDIEYATQPPREGWTTSSSVSFVAQIFPAVRMEHADAPALAVISKMMRALYLHREIREKGGAYGGFSLYSPEDGLFCYASYRDPHIVNTLDVYSRAADFIQSGRFADTDIDEAILQVCSEIDKPDPPGPAARKAFYRKLISLSDAARLRFKQRLLNLTRRQVLEAAAAYFEPLSGRRSVAVISGENLLREANRRLDPPLSIHSI